MSDSRRFAPKPAVKATGADNGPTRATWRPPKAPRLRCCWCGRPFRPRAPFVRGPRGAYHANRDPARWWVAPCATQAAAAGELPAGAPEMLVDAPFVRERGHRPTPKPQRPRCGAYARSTGRPCQAPAVWDPEHDRPRNGRCRMHGGTAPEPRTPRGRRRAEAAWAAWEAQRGTERSRDPLPFGPRRRRRAHSAQNAVTNAVTKEGSHGS